ncbi:flagellar hook-associated protein FlgK [Ruegeria sediminis]|uniref:Flagellar hook-associated protein 1 n=1 Tax=Ruegeria sediminis TaxID=2583820 RepID=A0ABY2WWH6_9RHOB|nr:flagellar hook-associated protein FlgK [Ruegeria sediminis]TMV07109.1 flagellar hook-associated protein FlgK [Ruegeria sediminis]
MTMSTAFQNALGGLAAASRGAAVVSDNIANALTPGYARRSLELASGSGPGVRIVGISRHADPVLTANRRNAEAIHSNADTVAGFFRGLEKLVGTPDDPHSLSGHLVNFENSLIAAASRPDAATRLDQVVTEAKALTGAINNAAEGLRKMRSDADRKIGQQVQRLNTTLSDIAGLNTRIQTARNSDQDVASMLDQRQLLVDAINELIPVNVVARENDRISLYAEGGLILLEGRAAHFTFATTGETMPHMTAANGLLSGLELNGQPVRTDGDKSGIRGGNLAALFEIRDTLSVEAQMDLDVLARDLIERFETPGLDPTAGPTAPGLFTDGGSRSDPTANPGLAARIGVNTLVDPGAGGSSWKLRTGLGATLPGDPGDARQLQAFSNVLSDTRAVTTNWAGTRNMSASEVGAALSSKIGQNAHTAEGRLIFTAATRSEMARIEAEQGVDTDAELQRMMRIEQAYAANARIIQTLDDLMETLLRL